MALVGRDCQVPVRWGGNISHKDAKNAKKNLFNNLKRNVCPLPGLEDILWWFSMNAKTRVRRSPFSKNGGNTRRWLSKIWHVTS
jgi:hypothetical protein